MLGPMKITDIEVIKITIPNRLESYIASKKTSEVHSTIIQVHTDAGIVGIGEAPFYPERAEFDIQEMRPRLLGEDPFNIENIVGTNSYEGPLCKTVAGVEMACWDIIGKALQVPVYKLLGGRVWEQIPITGFIGIMAPEVMLEEAVKAVNQGIQTLKIKVGRDPHQDVQTVRAIRQAVGEQIKIRIDANQGWSVATAIAMARKLADCDIQYMEQPIPVWDQDGLARLRQHSPVPVCICEGLHSLPQLMSLIKKDAIDFISTDPSRTGGLLGFKKFCAVAESAGIPVVTHVSASGVSAAAWSHATITARPCMYACDITYPGWDIGSWSPVGDVIHETVPYQNGFFAITDAPGLGISLHMDHLQAWAAYYQKNRQRIVSKETLEKQLGKPNAPAPYFMPPRF